MTQSAAATVKLILINGKCIEIGFNSVKEADMFYHGPVYQGIRSEVKIAPVLDTARNHPGMYINMAHVVTAELIKHSIIASTPEGVVI